MKYSSLYDYLNKHLCPNPSDQQIKECKRLYWEWYRKQHRRKRLTLAKSLNLTIPIELWRQLKASAINASMDVYDYIKQHLQNGTEVTLEMDRAFTLEIMQCLESIKDYMNGDISIETLYSILEHLILKL